MVPAFAGGCQVPGWREGQCVRRKETLALFFRGYSAPIARRFPAFDDAQRALVERR
jgi:hypothetical protein